jgi:hypothetical protein
MFGLAVRHDAMPANPVRDIATLPTVRTDKRTLSVVEVLDLRAKLAVDQKAVDYDLVDFADMMRDRPAHRRDFGHHLAGRRPGGGHGRGPGNGHPGEGPGPLHQAQAEVASRVAGHRAAELGPDHAQVKAVEHAGQ